MKKYLFITTLCFSIPVMATEVKQQQTHYFECKNLDEKIDCAFTTTPIFYLCGLRSKDSTGSIYGSQEAPILNGVMTTDMTVSDMLELIGENLSLYGNISYNETYNQIFLQADTQNNSQITVFGDHGDYGTYNSYFMLYFQHTPCEF